MKNIYFLILLLLVNIITINGQVTIGSLEDPHSGAVLHLKSGGNKGLLLPQVSLGNVNTFGLEENSANPASSAIGMVVYNTNESITGGKGKGAYIWSGTEWMLIGEGATPSIIQVTSIAISGDDRVDVGGSINLTATINPANATNQTVIWSISNGTGSATIETLSGKLTGTGSGTVFVYATAIDGSGVSAVKEITVNPVPVTSITILGSSTVAAGSSITLDVVVSPAEATNKNVTWLVMNGTGSAVVDATRGILLGISAGTVTVVATARDGSGVSAIKTITVEETNIPVSSITIDGPTSVSIGSSITLNATISPNNASNTGITWSVTNGTGSATINPSTGELTGVTVGSVTVIASAQDGTGKTASYSVTVTPALVTMITISGNSSVNVGSTAQYTAAITPINATNKTVTWTVVSGTGSATINSSTGVLTGVSIGSVTVIASAQDGSGKTASYSVTIASIPVTSVSVSPTSAALSTGSTQQLIATVYPTTATNKNVTWSSNNTSVATVSNTGVVTAKSSGTAVITVTTEDGSRKATSTITVGLVVNGYLLSENTISSTYRAIISSNPSSLCPSGYRIAKSKEEAIAIAKSTGVSTYQPWYGMSYITGETELYCAWKNEYDRFAHYSAVCVNGSGGTSTIAFEYATGCDIWSRPTITSRCVKE